MKKIRVDLENCYGINKLQHEFDFSTKNGCVIYASNGTMKTSFAKTFIDISNGNEPSDRIFNRPTMFNIEKMTNDIYNTIEADDIFVIESFKDNFNFEKISKLLVKRELKDRYDEIFNDIQIAKERLIRKMASLSKLRQVDIEDKFINDFPNLEGNFLDNLVLLEDEIDGNIEIPVTDIIYKIIFDDNILKFIKKDKIFNSIEEYTEKYLELIDKSEIFEKNVFTHNHAGNVGKELGKNNFFDAKHEVSLRNGQIIKSEEELEYVIQEQKDKILSDDNLKEIFEEIDSGLDKNKDTREFKKIIGNYPEIIPELRDIPEFKKKIWISILNTEKDLFCELIRIYTNGKDEIKEITLAAKNEESTWKDIVNLFNKRFFVPFMINVVNQEDVILKNEVPTIEFIYDDDNDQKTMNKDELLGILSNGEKRALYLLNIIYEIEARRLEQKPVLIITDDLADSFDYQNKYAIVEYLNDVLKEAFFKIIILTHNFDFYRTVGSRLDINRENCYMVLKNQDEIKIVDGQYLNSVFSYWKRQLNGRNVNNHKRIVIAAIPFVRNLIEYVYGHNHNDYNILTNLLHLRGNSESILLSDLKRIYSENWNVTLIIDDDKSVFDFIFEEVEYIIDDNVDEINLENKIALSMAIRLIAEDFMIAQISDPDKVEEIKRQKSKQTRKLFELFKDENDSVPILKYLEQVNLMTPENIHINSFMYEPILDMSDYHLKMLYQEIKAANDARVSN